MTAINTTTLQPAALGHLPELGANAPTDSSFKDMLVKSIHDVNQMQLDADRAVEAMSVGEDVNPAQVLTAVQKADLAFRMMMQVRNKMVEAFAEIKDLRI
ncbi:MAG: flagellar hook-basal body complex protein FliE [Planctomycetota bacterium]|nr:MAG: flagellar hook-basal body complex protein FliE [Planctomycetota bacterium]